MSKLLKYVIQIYWGLVRTDRSKIQHRTHKNEKTKKKNFASKKLGKHYFPIYNGAFVTCNVS